MSASLSSVPSTGYSLQIFVTRIRFRVLFVCPLRSFVWRSRLCTTPCFKRIPCSNKVVNNISAWQLIMIYINLLANSTSVILFYQLLNRRTWRLLHARRRHLPEAPKYHVQNEKKNQNKEICDRLYHSELACLFVFVLFIGGGMEGRET